MTAPQQEILARRYRRWLLAYPADYRRERGDELIGTLLDLAEAGRTRPAAGQVFSLLRSAAAQRVRWYLLRWMARFSPSGRARTVLMFGFLWATAVSPWLVISRGLDGFSCVDLADGFGIQCGQTFEPLPVYGPLYGDRWLILPWELAMVAALVRRRWVPGAAAFAMTVVLVLGSNTLAVYYLPSLLACWLGAVWVKGEGMPAAVGAAGIPDPGS